jgi:hypothetical protein
MKNLLLQPSIRQKIDRRVDKILRDLGNPEPPLRLEEVRELLRLHVSFYQTDSDGLMRRAIHNLVMAGKQILARPCILLDVVRKRGIKALVVPDRKRILIDETLHKAKHRWAEGHETIHTILEWHEPVLHGDNEVTMKQSCLDKVEAEANYGSGQLLFLRERFAAEALDSAPSVELVKGLAKSFKNTHASTLWRLVETAGRQRPMLGVMHYHPAARFSSDKNDPSNPCRHFIRSDAFASMFSATTELSVFRSISDYIEPKKGGPVGGDTVLLVDDNGVPHEFSFETFNFGHECLTLAVHLRKAPLVVGARGTALVR